MIWLINKSVVIDDLEINVIEHWRRNQEWTIQINWGHKTQNEDKEKTKQKCEKKSLYEHNLCMINYEINQ